MAFGLYYILFFALDRDKIKLLEDINKIYFQLVYLSFYLMIEVKKISTFTVVVLILIFSCYTM